MQVTEYSVWIWRAWNLQWWLVAIDTSYATALKIALDLEYLHGWPAVVREGVSHPCTS